VTASAPASVGVAAPPAPESWFLEASRCWCGGREHGPSPCSAEYFVCERCGTHVSRRRLRPDRVADFYSLSGYWHARQREKAHPTLLERRALLERDGRVDRWVTAIERHALGNKGVAVEIGCAEGTLLLRLRDRGWTVCGVEPDAATAAAVAAATGLDVRAGAFPDVTIPDCDLFVACDVLEHALEPQRLLEAAHARLRPGGLLFLQLPLLVPGEPDFGGITPKVFDPWEHSFIFSRTSIATLLAACGFEVLQNNEAWVRAHEFVVARRRESNPGPARLLANLPEIFSPEWRGFMDELNAFARPLGLREFHSWSKIWEYPALWRQGLADVPWSRARLVDIGSELSALPWWLATRGARVTLIERSANFTGHWEFVRRKLGVAVDWRIVDTSDLPLAPGSADVVTSLSVLEHQPDKHRAIDEIARVLRPGGLLALSCDLCEPEYGMAYPAWGGTPLTLSGFDALLTQHPQFEPVRTANWNTEDIEAFLAWHRETAPHHTYITTATVLRRLPGGWRSLQRRLRQAHTRFWAQE